MNVLSINNLDLSEALDRKAMAELIGGAERHLRGIEIVNGPWSEPAITRQFMGLVLHDGNLARHILETWKRTRVQTQYTYWDVYK